MKTNTYKQIQLVKALQRIHHEGYLSKGVGQLLLAVLDASGRTKTNLASVLGVSVGVLRRWEKKDSGETGLVAKLVCLASKELASLKKERLREQWQPYDDTHE